MKMSKFYTCVNRPPREQFVTTDDYVISVEQELSVKQQVERLMEAGNRLEQYRSGDMYDYDEEDVYEDVYNPDDYDPEHYDTGTDMYEEIERQEVLLAGRLSSLRKGNRKKEVEAQQLDEAPREKPKRKTEAEDVDKNTNQDA